MAAIRIEDPCPGSRAPSAIITVAPLTYIMPVSPSRYDLLRKRARRFARALDQAAKGEVEGLHRTRVASRRLREVLPVLQLSPDVAGDLTRRLRKVNRRLGTVRELDVILLLIDELRESARYDAEVLASLAAAVSRERDAERRHLLARIPRRDLDRVGTKLKKLARQLASEEELSAPLQRRRDVRWAVEARTRRRAAALRAAIDDAGAMYLPDRLHSVRIAMKKFRYAVELLADIGKESQLADHLRTLERAQDLLGRLRDRQVLIERTRQLQASLMPPGIDRWRRVDGVIASLDSDCRRLHARYVRDASAVVAVCDRFATSPASSATRRAG
jgi:CHAD domain-containing protein